MMEKYGLLILVVTLAGRFLAAQCPPGGLTFETQAQVDDFVATYPNCTEIDGSLMIGAFDETSSINDLTGLMELNAINGDLTIVGNPDLTNLNGLNGVTTVNGNLAIDKHESITDLTGLSGVTTIDGFLEVFDNEVLTSLSGLENIVATTINDLYILFNPQLSTCAIANVCTYLEGLTNPANITNNGPECDSREGVLLSCTPTTVCPEGDVSFFNQFMVDYFVANYPNCTEIEGDLIIVANLPMDITDISDLNQLTHVGGELRINKLHNLTDLTAFQNLVSVGGTLRISQNDGLIDLEGLNHLNTVGGDLNIQSNGGLTQLTGLDGLTTVGGDLSICYNESIVSIAGIEELNAVGENVSIIENTVLTAIPGLLGLNSVNGELKIIDNAALSSLSGLDNLSAVGDHITIENNSMLTDLAGLEGLVTLDRGLYIKDNAMLASLSGLDNLNTTGGTLSISNNPLTSLAGLQRLTTVGSSLFVANLDLLTNLSGLDSLKTIGSGLIIDDNELLTDLTALRNLLTIGETLRVTSNPTLADLTGLEKIAPESIGFLLFNGNPQLTNCALENICAYLSTDGAGAIISGNGVGCNSSDQIIEVCEDIVNVDDLAVQQSIAIYPNPTTGLLQLQSEAALISVIVYSPRGEVVARYDQPDGRVDLGRLPDGVYFLSCLTAEYQSVMRIVKAG